MTLHCSWVLWASKMGKRYRRYGRFLTLPAEKTLKRIGNISSHTWSSGPMTNKSPLTPAYTSEQDRIKAIVEQWFNPDKGVAHLASASKGLTILACHARTTAEKERVRKQVLSAIEKMRTWWAPVSIQGNRPCPSQYLLGTKSQCGNVHVLCLGVIWNRLWLLPQPPKNLCHAWNQGGIRSQGKIHPRELPSHHVDNFGCQMRFFHQCKDKAWLSGPQEHSVPTIVLDWHFEGYPIHHPQRVMVGVSSSLVSKRLFLRIFWGPRNLTSFQVVSVQSSTPLEVCHMCIAQKTKSLRQNTDSNLESLSIPSGLPDSATNILDGVIVELSENIEGHDHLVIIEGMSRHRAEHFFFVLIIFIAVAGISVFVRGLPMFTLGILASFQGFILGARHQHLAPEWGHCLAIARGQAAVARQLFVRSIKLIEVDCAWLSCLCGQSARVSAASLAMVWSHHQSDKLN